MAGSGKNEEAAAAAAPAQLFKDCWGCRAVSGGGLIGAGGYVLAAARRVMQRGAPPGLGAVAQIVFGLALLNRKLAICRSRETVPIGGRVENQRTQI
uniref:distal membrane-arm assembly complex protein 1-like isoform X1 n=1 Tax=Pristiophorus japonicus TaxID=55135 RepID=UPI00398E995A